MKQWEYKTELISKGNSSARLNEIGSEGWRLISAIATNSSLNNYYDCIHCIFEREKVEEKVEENLDDEIMEDMITMKQ